VVLKISKPACELGVEISLICKLSKVDFKVELSKLIFIDAFGTFLGDTDNENQVNGNTLLKGASVEVKAYGRNIPIGGEEQNMQSPVF